MHALKLSYTSSQEHGHSVRHAHKPPLNAHGKMHTNICTHMHTLTHTPTCMHTQKGSVMLCAETSCLPSLEAAPQWGSTPCLVYNTAPYGLWKIQAGKKIKNKKKIKCVIFNADKHPNILAQLDSLVSEWIVWLCLGGRGCIYTIFLLAESHWVIWNGSSWIENFSKRY